MAKSRSIILILMAFASLVFCFIEPCFAGSIVNSKHNLSATGPGTVKAVTEREICIFCHTPHNASTEAPLWNRYASGETYIPYTSTTFKATSGQPTGASKLCLSCHDGTVALGMVRSKTNTIQFTQPIGGEENLGKDLSDDHPISFRYDSALVSSDPELKSPATLTDQVRLDKNSEIQCTSCHDPHNDQYSNFLRVDAIRGNLCMSCHNMNGWSSSAHKVSNASWNGSSPNPWPHTSWNKVLDNGCESCHNPHGALGKKRLLNSSTEEDNCIPCHNGNVAPKNIIGEFNKSSIHPIYSYTGLHDPSEDIILTSNRHVECADCHNPHAASIALHGAISGPLKKVRGVNASGTPIDNIVNEYELCFRCHADSNYAAHNYVTRQFAENNTRTEFDPSNQSFHPVENIGKNANVPSLISPLTVSSIIGCGDCHNNDTGPGNSGTGPRGPHGSSYAPILERNLNFADNQSESLSAYMLCYKCHDRNKILSDNSFSEHKKHIEEEKTPCTTCHDSHGVKNTPHLINFDRNIVSENSSGKLSFKDNGTFHGSCSLTCHGEEHNEKSY